MTEESTRRGSRRWLIAAAVVVAVVVGAVAWVGVRAALAKNELEALAPVATAMRVAVAEGDLTAIAQAADDLGDHAARAAELTGDPVWRAMEWVPWAGDDLAAVRIVSANLDALSVGAIDPLLAVAETVATSTGPTDGSLDVVALRNAQEPIAGAVSVTEAAAAELTAIDTSTLIAPLAGGIRDLTDFVHTTNDQLQSIAPVVPILPALLGADGPRTILFVLQNNAELRTGGGITGTFAQFRADAGKLTLIEQADSSEFEVAADSVLPLPDSVTTLHGDHVGRFVQNASMTPDFALTAELAREWWRLRTGTTADAVVSIDPIVLKSLVAASGPVELPGEVELAAADLIRTLLVTPYLTLDQPQQNAFFAATTDAVFSRLFGSGIPPLTWLTALSGPIEQGRISVWSADAKEQAALVGTRLGGPAARQHAAGDDAFAVYFNDATGGKMDSFLSVDIASGTAVCRPDGRREVTVEVTLSSGVPADAPSAFPTSMTGGGYYGVAAGDIATDVAVSAPAGTFFGGVHSGGMPVQSVETDDFDFAVSSARLNVQPGQSGTLEFRFITDRTEDFSPVILHTPLLREPSLSTAKFDCR